MDGVLPEFRNRIADLRFHGLAIPMTTNVDGAPVARGSSIGADYWVRQIRAPVRFSQCVDRLNREGHNTFLEVGPRPLLTVLARKQLGRSGRHFLASARPDGDPLEVLAESGAKLFELGFDLRWQLLLGGGPRSM
jgi:acyl transferase domain-containing protein